MVIAKGNISLTRRSAEIEITPVDTDIVPFAPKNVLFYRTGLYKVNTVSRTGPGNNCL